MAHVRKARSAHRSHVAKTKKADRRTHVSSLAQNSGLEISEQLLKQNNSNVQQFALPIRLENHLPSH
jgi:hypothetical protein